MSVQSDAGLWDRVPALRSKGSLVACAFAVERAVPLGALDLATGKIHYRILDRKRWQEFLELLKSLRGRWPDDNVHVIADNFSPHKRAEVRDWPAAHDMELVSLPTYSSWLNWIESEFAALRYSALNGTDHGSHGEQDAAIGAYIP